MIARRNYKSIPAPVGPYVHSTRANGFLFLSGLTALGTPAQSSGITVQVKSILSQIEKILGEEKLAYSNIARFSIYVTDLSEVGEIARLVFAAFGDKLPASTILKVDGLLVPGLMVEVEATLVVTSPCQ